MKRRKPPNLDHVLKQVREFIRDYQVRREFFDESGDPRIFFQTAWAEGDGVVVLFCLSAGSNERATDAALAKLAAGAIAAFKAAHPDVVDISIKYEIHQ
jgi:hypothetical protein